MPLCGFVDEVDGKRRKCSRTWLHETMCGDGEIIWWHDPGSACEPREPAVCRIKGCTTPKREGYATCQSHSTKESEF